MKDDGKFLPGLEGLSNQFEASAKPIVKVDVEKYQAYLDESDLTEEEKKIFLQALWQIIVGFVELGFGVHPLQEVCGQGTDTSIPRAKGAFDALHSGETTTHNDAIELGPLASGPEVT